MKKTTLTFILFFGTLLVSCFKSQDCPPVKPYFKIKALIPYNLEFTNRGLNPWAVTNIEDTIAWDNYFVRIKFESEYYADNVNSNWVSFGQTLFALSCNENGYKGSKTGIKSINFIVLNDYNAKYAQNDTVNEIIKLNDWTYTIEDFHSYISINDFINMNSNSINIQNFEFKISEPPTENFKETEFRIVLELKDGQKFETQTNKIRLKK